MSTETPTKTYRLEVTGMHCMSCERTVSEHLKEVPGVIGVSASAAENSVEIVSAEPLDAASVASAVTAAGFTPGELAETRRRERRDAARRARPKRARVLPEEPELDAARAEFDAGRTGRSGRRRGHRDLRYRRHALRLVLGTDREGARQGAGRPAGQRQPRYRAARRQVGLQRHRRRRDHPARRDARLYRYPDVEARSRQREAGKISLVIGGMTCAACQQVVERTLKKVPGVMDAAVNLATETATVAFDPMRGGCRRADRCRQGRGLPRRSQGRGDPRGDVRRRPSGRDACRGVPPREEPVHLLGGVLDPAVHHRDGPAVHGARAAQGRRVPGQHGRRCMGPDDGRQVPHVPARRPGAVLRRRPLLQGRLGCAEAAHRQHGPAHRHRHLGGVLLQRRGDVHPRALHGAGLLRDQRAADHVRAAGQAARGEREGQDERRDQEAHGPRRQDRARRARRRGDRHPRRAGRRGRSHRGPTRREGAGRRRAHRGLVVGGRVDAHRRIDPGREERRRHRHRCHDEQARLVPLPRDQGRCRHRTGPDHPTRRGRPGLEGAGAAVRRPHQRGVRARSSSARHCSRSCSGRSPAR